MKHYIAQVEVSKRGDPSPEEIRALADRLSGYSVSMHLSPRGFRRARITVPADNLAAASTAALLAVTHGFGVAIEAAVSLEIMSESEAGLREGSVEVPELVGVADAAQLIGVSPQRVRQMIEEGKIAAHRVGERSFALVRSEVEATAKRLRTRGNEWMSHPGFLGLLEQLDIPIDRVIPNPKIRQEVETDGANRARTRAQYQFRILGQHPDGTVVPIADGQHDVTEFDITREGEWTSPE